jgi:hypothetical protein
VIVAPHALVAGGERESHGPIVRPTTRVVAPAEIRRDCLDFQAAARAHDPIRAKIELPERKFTFRRRAVAFAFTGEDTGGPERAGHDEAVGGQDAAMGLSPALMNPQPVQVAHRAPICCLPAAAAALRSALNVFYIEAGIV